MRNPDPPRRDDSRIWAIVAATVRPLPGRKAPVILPRVAASMPKASSERPQTVQVVESAPQARGRAPRSGPGPLEPIEPNRRRRLDLGRESLAARLDLHGLSQEAARDHLIAFIRRRREDNARAILVITGKGLRGDGVLRRQVPQWLGEAPLRELVAGISEAHPKKGGAGALYVVLRRKPG